jgi:hypothetical protein
MLKYIFNIFGLLKTSERFITQKLLIAFYTLSICIPCIVSLIIDFSFSGLHISLNNFSIIILYLFYNIDSNLNYTESNINLVKTEIIILSVFLPFLLVTSFILSIVFSQKSYIIISNLFTQIIYGLINILIIYILKLQNNIIINLTNSIDFKKPFSLEKFSINLLTVKYDYEVVIQKIQNFFSLLIFFGFTSMYFTVRFIFLYDWQSIIHTGILNIILIYSIFKLYLILKSIDDLKSKLNHNIKNNGILRQYLLRQEIPNNLSIEDEEFGNKVGYLNYSYSLETGRSIDFIIFNDIINSKWKELEFFGFEYDFISVVKKSFWFIWVYLIIKQFNITI